MLRFHAYASTNCRGRGAPAAHRSEAGPVRWRFRGLDPGTDSGVYTRDVATKASKRGSLRSGELAKLAGVSTDTLRHYERLGVLPAARRQANGYREYDPDAIEHLRLVRSALAVGFTLTELARILQVRRRGGVPCREVRNLAAGKLSEIDALLRDMTEMRNRLRATLKGWDARLERAGAGEPAGLLEALASGTGMDRRRRSTRVSGRFGQGSGKKRKKT